MSDKSKIEWCDATWQVLAGCTRESRGCEHCYSERLVATRLRHLLAYDTLTTEGRWTGNVVLRRDKLDEPLRWQKPRRIFVCDRGDLFQPTVPEQYVREVFEKTQLALRHTFLFLTKRPSRMREIVSRMVAERGGVPFPNCWLGTSVEDGDWARARIPDVLATPATLRFLSVEPLLGDVDLRLRAQHHIDWVIVGPETGPEARRTDNGTIADVLHQCRAAGIPCLIKKAYTPASSRPTADMSLWPAELRVREVPR